MSKIKEVLRLKYLNKLFNRQIASLCGVSRNSVANYINSFNELSYPLEDVLALSESELEELFYSKGTHNALRNKQSNSDMIDLDWVYIKEELTKKGMTRALLYEELKQTNPNIYSYSQFNRKYASFIKRINPSMRQVHYGGDKLFIDYSGLTMPIINQRTGEIDKAQIFVSVLGASGYTFVHASSSQSTKDFIYSHVEAFRFYGGIPNILVPDNLKAAVISNKKGVVKLNSSYEDMGRYYKVAIVPARPYKPQDKSKVELGVKAIQRWILMRLRNHTFFSVDELNYQIGLLLDGYNNKIVKRLQKSRTELFELLDKPYLSELPVNNYIYKEFKSATVGVDYHVELDGSGYSVPYIYLGKRVDISHSLTSVTISHNGIVIAHHTKMQHRYNDSTKIEHMPKEHEYQFEKWNPRRLLNWASQIGVNTLALIEDIINSKSHPTRAYRSCMAILSFSKRYGVNEMELALGVAKEHKIYSVSSIESMLKTKSYMSHHKDQSPRNNNILNNHENIRGSHYYNALVSTTSTLTNTTTINSFQKGI